MQALYSWINTAASFRLRLIEMRFHYTKSVFRSWECDIVKLSWRLECSFPSGKLQLPSRVSMPMAVAASSHFTKTRAWDNTYS